MNSRCYRGLAWRWDPCHKILLYTHTHTYIARRKQAYPHTADLLACRSNHKWHDQTLSLIHTPHNVHIWTQCLQAHPDQALAWYGLKGMTAGFRIGYDSGQESANRPATTCHQYPCTRGCTAKPGPGSGFRQTTGTISARWAQPTSARQQVWRNREA